MGTTNRDDVDMTPLAAYGRIFVNRIPTALDRDRTYLVCINGVPVQALAVGAHLRCLVVVPPGNRYTLHMELGGLRSDPITVRMKPNEEITLTCHGIQGGTVKRSFVTIFGAGCRIRFEQDKREHGNDRP